MTRSQRIEGISRVAEVQVRDCAERLAASHRAVAEMEGQLANLQACRAEYLAQLHAGALPIAAGQLQDLQRFLVRLDQAIDQLQGRIREGQRAVEADRGRLVASRQRTQTLDRFAARCRADEAQRAETRLQREVDDRSQRADPLTP